jgi:thiol-disulfide isomerase/thioredoxin
MTNIVEVIYNKYIKVYSLYILIAFIVIVFVVAGYFIYKKYFEKTKKNVTFKDVANSDTRAGVVEIFFFHVDWCPHCKNAMPIWKQFKDEYDGKTINNHKIQCNSVDCTNEEDSNVAAIIHQYKLESYPTVILLVDNNKIDFDAKITKSALEQFVNSATK